MVQSTCEFDYDCSQLQYCIGGECKTKELFPISGQEIFGTLFISLINSVGTSIGVSEGALLVPFIVLIMQRRVHHSLHYAIAMVFGGSVGNILNVCWLRHPITKQPAINYDINLLILPLVFSGVMLGAIFHSFMPEIAVFIVMIAVMVYVFLKSYKNYMATKEKENVRGPQEAQDVPELEPESAKEVVEERAEAGEMDINENEKQAFMDENKSINEDLIETLDDDFVYDPQDEEENKGLTEDQEEEKQDQNGQQEPERTQEQKNNKPKPPSKNKNKEVSEQHKEPSLFPWKKYREFILLMAIIIFFKWVIGGKGTPSLFGVPYCQSLYWVLFALSTVLFGLFFIRYRKLVVGWQKHQLKHNVQLYNNDILLTKERLRHLAILSFLAGIMASVVGIGAGMMIGPSLITYGMSPKYQAKTTSFSLIFTMLAAIIQEFFTGDIGMDEIAWFTIISLIVSYIASKVVMAYVNRTGKQSMLVLLLLVLIVISGSMMVGLSINNLVEDWDKFVKVNDICYTDLKNETPIPGSKQ